MHFVSWILANAVNRKWNREWLSICFEIRNDYGFRLDLFPYKGQSIADLKGRNCIWSEVISQFQILRTPRKSAKYKQLIVTNLASNFLEQTINLKVKMGWLHICMWNCLGSACTIRQIWVFVPLNGHVIIEIHLG